MNLFRTSLLLLCAAVIGLAGTATTNGGLSDEILIEDFEAREVCVSAERAGASYSGVAHPLRSIWNRNNH